MIVLIAIVHLQSCNQIGSTPILYNELKSTIKWLGRDKADQTFRAARQDACGAAAAIISLGIIMEEAQSTEMPDIATKVRTILPSQAPNRVHRSYLWTIKDIPEGWRKQSKKADHLNDAPHTVFARCLYISKAVVESSTRELLEKSCKQTGTMLSILSIQNIHNDA